MAPKKGPRPISNISAQQLRSADIELEAADYMLRQIETDGPMLMKSYELIAAKVRCNISEARRILERIPRLEISQGEIRKDEMP